MATRLFGTISPRALAFYSGKAAIITAAYYGAAQTGFAFAFQTKQVTAIWPPTGLALAALVLGGKRLWPAVALGAFLANIATNETFLTALGITVGNTLEAVLGAWALSLVPQFQSSLERIRDVLTLVVGAAVLSTMVSATIGVLSLIAGNALPSAAFWSVWRVWWLGDLGGDLLIAPALLVFGTLLRHDPRRAGRAAIISATLAGVLAVFGAIVFTSSQPLAYLLFPVLFGVALRFRQPGGTLGSFALACVAVWATKNGHGQFAIGSPDSQLLRAQTFVGVAGLTAMLVAAVRTERQAAEEQVTVVEQKVAERTQELVAANKELEAFSYSVSHDLRAPLRAIDGYSKAIIEDYTDKLDNDGVSMLQRVRAASQRMAQLIDEMLMLSQLTRRPMQREEVDLSSMAREIAGELTQDQPQRPAEFTIEDGLIVAGDSELLRTALRNLFENAWKFSAKQPKSCIEFIRSSDGKQTKFVVRDNGAGFDMRYSDKLFQPFESLHQQAEFAGTGVGLTTVQRVVRRHGGSVWAESSVGNGAAFYFTLDAEHGLTSELKPETT